MAQNNSRRRLTKRGTLSMLLVIIVVVIFVMMAIVSLLLSYSYKHSAVVGDLQASTNLNFIIDTVSIQGEYYLKTRLGNDLVITDFETSESEKEYFLEVLTRCIPSDLSDDYVLENVSVEYGVEVYQHGVANHGFDLVTVNIKFYEHGEEKTCSVGFFQANATRYANSGADYEIGDFVYVWKH